jgi:predicted acyl esterase
MPISRRDVLRLGSAAGISSFVAPLCAEDNLAPPKWTLPERKPFEIVENEWIPMQVGIRLAARLWIPEGAMTKPVVFEYLPYRLWDDLRWREAQQPRILRLMASPSCVSMFRNRQFGRDHGR